MEAKGNGMSGVQKKVEGYTNTTHQAVDRAAEAATAMAGRLGEQAGALGMKGEELLEMKDQWLEGGREYVREHPFQALGIALAAGYLLSMMMRSK